MIRRSVRSFLPKLTSTVAVAALMLGAANVGAAEAERNFDIRAQELSRALLAFSQQSDLVVVAAADLVANLPAPPVTGRMTPEDAIERLLRGSGLQFVQDKDGTIRIIRAEVAAAGESARRDEVEPAAVEEIVVTGSHIQGPVAAGILPVSVRSSEDLAAVRCVDDRALAARPGDDAGHRPRRFIHAISYSALRPVRLRCCRAGNIGCVYRWRFLGTGRVVAHGRGLDVDHDARVQSFQSHEHADA